MKRFILFITLTLLVTTSNSVLYASSLARLKSEVKAIKEQLPITAKQGVTLFDYSIINNDVVITNIVDTDYVDFKEYVLNPKQRKKSLLKSYYSVPALKSFAELVVKCNMNILVLYICKQTGETSELLLETQSLKECIE